MCEVCHSVTETGDFNSHCNHAIRWLIDRATETGLYFIDIDEIQGFFLFLKFDSFVSRSDHEGFHML